MINKLICLPICIQIIFIFTSTNVQADKISQNLLYFKPNLPRFCYGNNSSNTSSNTFLLIPPTFELGVKANKQPINCFISGNVGVIFLLCSSLSDVNLVHSSNSPSGSYRLNFFWFSMVFQSACLILFTKDWVFGCVYVVLVKLSTISTFVLGSFLVHNNLSCSSSLSLLSDS